MGNTGVFLDPQADAPYTLHFFEMSIRGQDSRGDPQTLYGEVVAVREGFGPVLPEDRFTVVPADCLLDLAPHANPPAYSFSGDAKAAADYLKTSYQMQRRQQCQQDREHFATVCRDYLMRSFTERKNAAQARVIGLMQRERENPEVAIARQRAENDLADLERLKRERLAGIDRLIIARHGPVKHLASALIVPAVESLEPEMAGWDREPDPETRRAIELAAEAIVIRHEESQGRECEKVGHLKIGFDIRSLAPADPQTGYRDPVLGVRRIEVKGRKRGRPVRLTKNEWYKATQLGDSYWLYVVWDPLGNPEALPIRIQNPAKKLDHVKREIAAIRFFEIPAGAIESYQY